LAEEDAIIWFAREAGQQGGKREGEEGACGADIPSISDAVPERIRPHQAHRAILRGDAHGEWATKPPCQPRSRHTPADQQAPQTGRDPGLVLHWEEGGTGIPKLRRACSRLALRGICSCCVRTCFTACPLPTAMPGRQATVRNGSASRGGGRGRFLCSVWCLVSSV